MRARLDGVVEVEPRARAGSPKAAIPRLGGQCRRHQCLGVPAALTSVEVRSHRARTAVADVDTERRKAPANERWSVQDSNPRPPTCKAARAGRRSKTAQNGRPHKPAFLQVFCRHRGLAKANPDSERERIDVALRWRQNFASAGDDA